MASGIFAGHFSRNPFALLSGLNILRRIRREGYRSQKGEDVRIEPATEPGASPGDVVPEAAAANGGQPERSGAGEREKDRAVFCQSILTAATLGLILALLGTGVSPFLSGWLGGKAEIRRDASSYFSSSAARSPFCNSASWQAACCNAAAISKRLPWHTFPLWRLLCPLSCPVLTPTALLWNDHASKLCGQKSRQFFAG